jgi:cytochrome c biogenesis protein CcmG/thiol:disulfide interchange protein DsbE
MRIDRSRGYVLLGLAVAAFATVALLQLRSSLPGQSPGTSGGEGLIAKGAPVPAIVGTTIDGTAFDLADLRGRPVIVNFWGPSCVPCRDEFPLFLRELQTHQQDGLVIVGVLMYDAPAPARDFVASYHATWQTVDDPAGAIRAAYRVAARPQSYFVDRNGILRSIQVGQLTECEFDRQYALISGPVGASAAASPAPCGNGAGGQPSPSIEIPPPQ